MSKSAQNGLPAGQAGIALPILLLIVAGIIIVGLLSDKVNIKTETPQPTNQQTESTASATPATVLTISPSPQPSPTSTPRTKQIQPTPIGTTASPTSPTPEPSPQTPLTNEAPSPTSSPTSFKPKLPISTFIPIPTEKNLVPLASSYGASSIYGVGYEAQKAFDGSTSTRWSAAKDNFYGKIWIEWPTEKIITSIGWTALPSKYGAPQNFLVECADHPSVGGRPLTYSKLGGSYQESQWSDNSPKDTGVKPVKARWCSIFISSVQNQTYAATLIEIQVKGY